MGSPRPEPIDQRSRPVKRRIRWEKLILVILLGYILAQGMRGLWRQHEMTARYRGLQKQLTAEVELKDQQQRKLERLQDPRYIEFLARDRLGLVKRGETVYKLAEPQTSTNDLR